MIEFNYQDGVDGKPLLAAGPPASTRTAFFLADEERDFALVAVRATPAELAPFGFNRLIEAEGKAIIGEFVTIVQHPRGEKKQIALRENRIVDIPDRFLHYSADTEPGSSGSPVFNDQWEVVALHHASVPRPSTASSAGSSTRGSGSAGSCSSSRSRRSRRQRALADQLFAAPRRRRAPAGRAAPRRAGAVRRCRAAGRRGDDHRAGRDHRAARRATARRRRRREPEAISIDPDYANRGGYDPAFLAQPLPLPVPGPALAADASDELRYHHFSVVMHRERALALFTAVNIDGKLARAPEARARPLDPRPAAARERADRRGRLPRQPARPRPPRAAARPGVGHRRTRSPRRPTTTRSTSRTPRRSTTSSTPASTLWAGPRGLRARQRRHRATSPSASSPARCWPTTTTPTAASSSRASSGRSSRWSSTDRRAVGDRLPAQPGGAARRAAEATRRSPTARTARSRCRSGGSPS